MDYSVAYFDPNTQIVSFGGNGSDLIVDKLSSCAFVPYLKVSSPTLVNPVLNQGESLVTAAASDLYKLDYLWENYSNSFSILRNYETIKSYEKMYNRSSEQIFAQWKEGNLFERSSKVNDWLSNYIQIRSFIHEAA